MLRLAIAFTLVFSFAYATDKPLDLDVLSDLIQKSEKQVRCQIQSEVGNPTRVLVLGVTGSGKSTLVHSLVGKKMMANDKYGLDVIDGLLPGFSIGHGLDSSTTIPNSYYDPNTNLVYWDCPGFMDSRGQGQEIVNSFAIDQIFSEPSRVKILFVIQDSEFQNERGWPVIARLKKIISLVPDKRQLKQGLSLIVTQKFDHRFSPQDQLRELLEDARQSRDLEDRESVIDLLNFLTGSTNQVFTFPAPQQKKKLYELFSDKDQLVDGLQKSPVVNPRHAMSFDANVFWCIKEMVRNFADIPGLIIEFEDIVHLNYRGKDLPILKEWKSFSEVLSGKISTIKTPHQLVEEFKKSLPLHARKEEGLTNLMDQIISCQRYLDFAQKIDRDGLINIELSDVSKVMTPFLRDMDSELQSLIQNKEFLIKQEQARIELEGKLDAEVKAGKIAREEADKQMKELELRSQEEKERASAELKKLETQLKKNKEEATADLEKALRSQQERYTGEMDRLKTEIREAEKKRKEAEDSARASASSSHSDAHTAALLKLFQGMSMNGGGMMPPPYSIGGMEGPMPFGNGGSFSPARSVAPRSTGRFDHAAIAAAYNGGALTQRQVARQFGCSQSTVSNAVRKGGK